MPDPTPETVESPSRAYTVSPHTSASAVETLLTLVNAAEPILDTTFGSGRFWVGSPRYVIGSDYDPGRGRDLVASFHALPFLDGAIPTVIFDPPFHPDVNSREETRFRAMGKTEIDLRRAFIDGCLECWRVAGRHLIVKCQGYIHNHAPQWMELWAIEALGEPFEWLTATRPQKVVSGRWGRQRSLYRNHASYLLFDKRGNKR